MRAILVGSDSAMLARYGDALEGEGLAVRYQRDFIKLTGSVDPAVLGVPPAQLMVLSGAPVPVLVVMVTSLRKLEAAAGTRLLVLAPDLGLNDSSKLLRAGADDVRGEMPDTPMFLARARALLRRAGEAASDPELDRTRLIFGPLMLDLVARSAQFSGKPFNPTRLQFDILAAIARAEGHPVLHAKMLEELERRGHGVDAAALNACMAALSKELSVFGHGIERVSTGGWRLGPAKIEETLPLLGGELLRLMGDIVSRARNYGVDHGGVETSLELLRVMLSAVAGQAEASPVLTWERDGFYINGIEPEWLAPAALKQFFAALGFRRVTFKSGCSLRELKIFFELAKLRVDQAEQLDAVEYFARKGCSGIEVDASLPRLGRTKTPPGG